MEVQDGRTIPIQGWTLVPLYLQFFDDQGEMGLAKATGFFWESGGRLYLVSAHHCLSGRSIYDPNRPMDRHGRIPTRVRAMIPEARIGGWQHRDFALCDANGDPLWFEHPVHGRTVDVAVLPIPETQWNDLKPRTAQSKEQAPDMQLLPAQSVFLLGYPLGLAVQRYLAIWKQATIASEPHFDPEDLPVIYVDGAPTRGMSGCPVIARASGPYKIEDGRTIVPDGVATRFLGVYSGRRLGTVVAAGDDPERELDAQLGTVWKRSALDEIILGQKKGTDRHRWPAAAPQGATAAATQAART